MLTNILYNMQLLTTRTLLNNNKLIVKKAAQEVALRRIGRGF